MSTEPVARIWLARGRAFLAYAAKRFVDDRCPGIAATLSYTSLLALVPLAAIAFAVLAVFPLFEGAREQIQAFVFNNFVPDTNERLAEHFDAFVDNAGGLTSVGIAGLVVTATMLLATIGSALNTIFRVARPRRLLSRLIIYAFVITLGPLVLGASVVLATNIPAWAAAAGIGAFPWLAGRLGGLVPVVIVVAAFSLLYAVVPNRTVPWRHAIAGGVAAGILFSVLRLAFGVYLVAFPVYRTLYGALAVLPIFLVWMYLSWAAVLFGAVLTASLADRRAGGQAGMDAIVPPGGHNRT